MCENLFLSAVSASGLKSQVCHSSEHVRSGSAEKQPEYCTNFIIIILKRYFYLWSSLSYE